MVPTLPGQMRGSSSRQASACGHPRSLASLRSSGRQSLPQKRWHSLSSGPSIWHGPAPYLQAPRLCSTRPVAATDHVEVSEEIHTTSGWTKVLWVGNIPREMEVEAAEAALRQAYPAQHVEVVGFASSTQRSSYPKGCLHRGFALVVVHHPDEAPAAAHAILGTALGPEPLLAQPALRAPEEWPPEYTLHGEALEQHRRREAERERLRGHRKRNWQRQLAAYQQQLGEILDALPEPGGLQVARAYQQLAPALQDAEASSNSSSEGCTAAVSAESAPSQLASTAGPVTSPRRTHHLLHWPSMPAACDTIVGGNLVMHGNLGQVLSAGSSSSTGSNSRSRSRSTGSDAGKQQQQEEQEEQEEQQQEQEQPVPARTLRKRLQVESFLLLLLQMLKPSHMPSCQDAAALKAHIQQLALQAELSNSPGSTGGADHIPIQQYRQYEGYQFVEFGCGTGNLVLPLARLLPGCQFHAIDMKWRSVELLEQRAKAAGLSNLTAAVGRIEQYEGPCDVALALHACGSASDYSLLQAARCRAAYIVSPCCVGKLQASLAAAEARASGSSSCGSSEPGLRLVHPRSRWMVGGMASLPLAESFRALAQAADYSHTDNHGHPELAALCKSNIELDRSMAALEDGYNTALVKLLQPELTTKSDVLVGAPAERIGQDFAWWWQ